MQTAYFRFYEELNDFLPPEKRKVLFGHAFRGRVSVKDMIESLGVPHSEIDLILINGISRDFSCLVNDNDHISVYPMFESFDITEITHLRGKPLRRPAFVLDVHLGRLAGYMRMLGIDSLYSNRYSKQELIDISLSQRRAILTRDRHLLMRNEITRGFWIRSDDPVEQMKEVFERFQLRNFILPFSRCMKCNSELSVVGKESVAEKLPPKVRLYFEDFFICQGCGKIYWKGSHYEAMRNMIDKITS